MSESIFDLQLKRLKNCQPLQVSGSVSRIVGLVAECRGLRVPVGSLCKIKSAFGEKELEAEVVGFKDDTALLMPYGELTGLSRGDRVVLERREQEVPVSDQLLGRVVNCHGVPIDGKGKIVNPDYVSLQGAPPNPLTRDRIDKPLQTGVRAIDALTTIGQGQRMGLFAGSGVGKSVLMGMIARNTNATINVIALIGERGREVREFLEKELGEEGLKHSVVVVATSNESALLRVKAAATAASIAEYFRDQGKDVLMLFDSVTRIAYAQREIGLSVGEPPTTKGYPPSVFSMMPKLLERAGRSDKGSITGIFTVLVESDDVNEPVADTVRSILDGHIWLNRDLVAKGHYPAVDPSLSISRVMVDVTDDLHQAATRKFVSWLSAYREAEDLINIGAYARGSNPRIDTAIDKIDIMNEFLQQQITERSEFAETRERLLEICDMAEVAVVEEEVVAVQERAIPIRIGDG